MITEMDSMKEKISVTVESDLIKWVDANVETQRFRNRSHAFELALMELKKKEA
jgi:Arc/MetJ-type ribon-helix-helix transcriptional regulator